MKAAVGYGNHCGNKKVYTGSYAQWRLIMKGKRLVCLAAMLILLGLTLNAQEGYQGPGLTPITVQEAKELRNASPIALKGKIEAFLWVDLDHPVWEYYIFSDETGSITLTIDKRLWKGLSVDENDVLEITGKIQNQKFFVQRIKKI